MLKKIFKNEEFKFLAVFLLSAAGFGMGIIALAIVVDPYNIFGVNLFKPILLTNRTEKLHLLRDAREKPEAIIFGSSRVFKMEPQKIQTLTGLRSFNASVSYARPEEHYAMDKYIVQDLDIKPKLFLVGVNLGEFNNDEIDYQTINNPDLRKYLPFDRRTRIITILKTFKERFSPNYVRDIFVTIFWNSHGFPNPTITFGPDGGEIFDKNLKTNHEDISVTENLAMDLFKELPILSQERKQYFDDFLNFAHQKNIRVIIFLLPFPPNIVEKLRQETNYESLMSEFLEEAHNWEKKYSVKFYDFSDVQSFNGLSDDFDDSTHPSHKNIDLMTERMLKGFKL